MASVWPQQWLCWTCLRALSTRYLPWSASSLWMRRPVSQEPSTWMLACSQVCFKDARATVFPRRQRLSKPFCSAIPAIGPALLELSASAQHIPRLPPMSLFLRLGPWFCQ